MGDNTTTQKNQASQTGRTETQATPYSATQPLYDRGFGAALDNFDRTSMPSFYGEATNQGARGVAALARGSMQADPLDQTLNVFKDTFAKDGYNQAQRDSMSYLNPTARGDFVNLENPDFQRVLGRAMEDASTEASMVASGMGRSGSDFHQGLVADRVGDMSADARLGQYNLERDRQTNAISQMFGMGQTGMGNVANAGNTYESLLGARMFPSTALMQLGQTPNNELERLFGAASAGLPFARSVGASSGSSNNTGSMTQPSNTFGQVAGGLLGGASLLFG